MLGALAPGLGVLWAAAPVFAQLEGGPGGAEGPGGPAPGGEPRGPAPAPTPPPPPPPSAGAPDDGAGAPDGSGGSGARRPGAAEEPQDIPADLPVDEIFTRLERIVFDLHAVAPRAALQDLALLERLKTKRSFDARLLGVLARAYAERAVLDGDRIWAERAVSAGRRAVQINPNLAVAYSGLGWALLSQARYHATNAAERRTALTEALSALREAVTRGHERGWVDLYGQGVVWMERGRPDDAVKAFRAALVGNRLCWEPHEGIGRTYALSGDLLSAAKAWEAAAEKALNSEVYLLSDRAREEAADDLNELTEYEKDYRKAAAGRAGAAAAHGLVEAARLYRCAGRSADAIRVARKAIGLPHRVREGDLVLAELLLAGGKVEEAWRSLGPPGKDENLEAQELDLRGRVRLAEGKSDEARELLGRALKRLPLRWTTLAALARLAMLDKDLKTANRYATWAVRRGRWESGAWRVRAEIREKRGDVDGARSDAARAQVVEAAIVRAHKAGRDVDERYRLHVARDLLRAHRYRDALRWIEPVCTGDGDDEAAALLKIQALAGLGNPEGVRLAKAWVAKAPGSADLQAAAAQAALAAKDRASARKYALRAINLARSPVAQAILARIDTSGARRRTGAAVEERVSAYERERAATRRLAMLREDIKKGNRTALLLLLPTEQNDEVLAAAIEGLAQEKDPEVRKAIQSRALGLKADQPRAQLAAIAALARSAKADSAEALAALVEHAANDEVKQRAKAALGKVTVATSIDQLAVLMDPSGKHDAAVEAAYTEEMERRTGQDYIPLLSQILRYGSIVAIVVLFLFRRRRRQREAAEQDARSAQRRRRH